MAVDPFQAEVAQIALRAAAGYELALAGGNALRAHGLLDRLTQDVDLFTPLAGVPGAVTAAVRAALVERGYEVDVLRAPGDHGGDFSQLEVRGPDGSTTALDLARDPRRREPVQLLLNGQPCPVLDLPDALANKMGALLGRGLPRDFIDIAAVLGRFDRGQLLAWCFEADPGLRVEDAAHSVWQLDGLPDRSFAEYGLDSAAVAELRARFAEWPRASAGDKIARDAFGRAHQLDVPAVVRAAASSYPHPPSGSDRPPAMDAAAPSSRRRGQPPTTDSQRKGPRSR